MALGKTRIFISFSVPFDLEARNRLYALSLSPNSKASVASWSISPGTRQRDWRRRTREEIAACDVVVALVGEHASSTPNVREELAIAQKLGKRVFAIRIHEEAVRPDNVNELHEWRELDSLVSDVRVSKILRRPWRTRRRARSPGQGIPLAETAHRGEQNLRHVPPRESGTV